MTDAMDLVIDLGYTNSEQKINGKRWFRRNGRRVSPRWSAYHDRR